MANSSNFDPFSQPFSILAPDGITQIPVPLNEVHSFQNIVAQAGIMFGIRLGVCFILLLVLLMMTKSDKRRTIVFLLNFLSLLLLFIQSVLMCVELTGPFYNYYSLVTGYYVDLGGAIRVSVAAEVINFLAELTLELSMMFQVHVICCTVRPLWRNVITVFSMLVVLTVVAIRFATMVLNADYGIVHVSTVTDQELGLIDRLTGVHNIAFICSIYYFSGMFCAKLGHAILRRRTMCMNQFGAMQIIFIMGCQTLIVPATFGILAFFVLRASRIQALMFVVLAAFLPLSSLWASANTANMNNDPAQRPHGGLNFMGPRPDHVPASSDSSKRHLISEQPISKERSPASTENGSTLFDSIDLEMQKTHPDTQVKRSFGLSKK